MGVTSNVGVAIRSSLAKFMWAVRPSIITWLENESAEHYVHDVGELFVFHDFKWYNDEMVDQLNKEIELFEKDALILEACETYPSDESMCDRGSWHDNPWKLGRCVSVSLTYRA